MKVQMMLDIDTDRKESPVQIHKPPNRLPMSEAETNNMILEDMGALCEAVCTLIHVAEERGAKKSADSLRDCIDHLQKGFADASYKTEMRNPGQD